jgi:Amt family ammonium transporter
MPGHNASLTLLGVFLLWFGWYGFNPGSTNAIVGSVVGFSKISAAVAVNTTVAAAAGTLSCLFTVMIHQYIKFGVITWDLIIAGNGALAGLVSITGPCAFVQTWAALLIGIIGGLVYYGASKLILLVFKVDDPVDAIAVHAACGMWGMLASGAFADAGMVTDWYGTFPGGTAEETREYGFIMGGSGAVLAASIVYIICIAAWVLGVMTPFFLLIKKLGVFRVSPEVESAGLDVSHHGGSAYPHESGPTKGGLSSVEMTPAMVRRQIDEAMDSLRLELRGAPKEVRNGDAVAVAE